MSASTSTFTSSIEITIDDVVIRRVNYLRISQRFEGHHSFEISVSPSMLTGQSSRLRDLADTLVGERCSIRLSQTRAGAATQTQLFVGGVSAIRLVKGQSQTDTYIISGLSLTMFLEAGKHTQSFIDKTIADIVNASIGSSSRVSCSPTYTAPIPYITQYDEDRFHFLQRLAETYGEWFYYDGEKVIFGKNARVSSPTIALTNDSNLFDLEYGLRVLPFKFKASYVSYETYQRFDADSSAEQVAGLSSYSQLALDKSNRIYGDDINDLTFTSPYSAESELKTAVKLQKSERTTKLAVLSGRTPEMELKIGGLISVREPIYADGRIRETVDYGTFVVTQLNHSIDSRGVYQAYFQAIPQDTDFAPVSYNIIPRLASPQTARVKEINDPLKLGRVKVRFWWQGGRAHEEVTTPWIRVSSMMTSHSKSYFIPEIDDIVMIGFEYGNPDLPYVIGSLYAKDGGIQEPGNELFTSDNHLKGIITRGDNHIIIDDTDGKEKISIYNKDKKNKIELSLDGTHISITSNGDINLTAGGDIKMKAKNIKMEAETDWKVKADHAVIETQSGDIEFISGKDLLETAMVNVKIGATAELSATGTIIKIEADATAEIKANAKLDIDGGAMATLKGGMVMIN